MISDKFTFKTIVIRLFFIIMQNMAQEMTVFEISITLFIFEEKKKFIYVDKYIIICHFKMFYKANYIFVVMTIYGNTRFMSLPKVGVHSSEKISMHFHDFLSKLRHSTILVAWLSFVHVCHLSKVVMFKSIWIKVFKYFLWYRILFLIHFYKVFTIFLS